MATLSARGWREGREYRDAEVQEWASQNHIEEQLLHCLWSLLTPGLPVVIVADRGFARANLFRWFRRYQRQFVTRFDADTWLCLPERKGGAAEQVLPLRPGERRWIPHA